SFGCVRVSNCDNSADSAQRGSLSPARRSLRLGGRLIGFTRSRPRLRCELVDRTEARSHIVVLDIEGAVPWPRIRLCAPASTGRVKERAAKVLADMGLSVSDAIRLLLVRVA